MQRFVRQQLITGWNQSRISGACVAVYGRDWVGTFTTWALASLGVGTIVWFGRPRDRSRAFADWLLSDPPPISDVMIYDYPMDVEYGSEMAWGLGASRVDLVIDCTDNSSDKAVTSLFAKRRKIRWLGAMAGHGGWLGMDEWPTGEDEPQDPVIAMIVAGVLADSARQVLCPLAEDELLPEGRLDLTIGTDTPAGDVVLVGAGGIGIYALTALTALAALGGDTARRCYLHVRDFDRVELANLNRQGLFKLSDARIAAYKAPAARRALMSLFPQSRIQSTVCRVDASFEDKIKKRPTPPAALLSAVDNAATRLLLQDVGRHLQIPVIQGSTDTFAADCYTQTMVSPTLDDQMMSQLSVAAARESAVSRRVGCAADPSYVCPGMIAGAMMVHQLRLSGSEEAVPAFHWRSGSLPIQRRSNDYVFDFGGVTF